MVNRPEWQEGDPKRDVVLFAYNHNACVDTHARLLAAGVNAMYVGTGRVLRGAHDLDALMIDRQYFDGRKDAGYLMDLADACRGLVWRDTAYYGLQDFDHRPPAAEPAVYAPDPLNYDGGADVFVLRKIEFNPRVEHALNNNVLIVQNTVQMAFDIWNPTEDMLRLLRNGQFMRVDVMFEHDYRPGAMRNIPMNQRADLHAGLAMGPVHATCSIEVPAQVFLNLYSKYANRNIMDEGFVPWFLQNIGRAEQDIRYVPAPKNPQTHTVGLCRCGADILEAGDDQWCAAFCAEPKLIANKVVGNG